MTFSFDLDAHDYGPASPAIRALLREWANISWFVPTSTVDSVGIGLFQEHNRLAYAADPHLFEPHTGVRVEAGDWATLARWCTHVRTREQGPDWKFSILKTVSRDHCGECDWVLESEAARLSSTPPAAGDLFTIVEGYVMYNSLTPKVDIADDHARFYLEYAHHDLWDALTWQLAERSPDTSTNPFIPLLRCYRTGFYPFYLGMRETVLFRFPCLPASIL